MFKFLKDLAALLATVAEIREDIRDLLRTISEFWASLKVVETKIEFVNAKIEDLEKLAEQRLCRLENLESEIRGFMSRKSDREFNDGI